MSAQCHRQCPWRMHRAVSPPQKTRDTARRRSTPRHAAPASLRAGSGTNGGHSAADSQDARKYGKRLDAVAGWTRTEFAPKCVRGIALRLFDVTGGGLAIRRRRLPRRRQNAGPQLTLSGVGPRAAAGVSSIPISLKRRMKVTARCCSTTVMAVLLSQGRQPPQIHGRIATFNTPSERSPNSS